jgi:dTDP-4-dehydrorhamnose reductase
MSMKILLLGKNGQVGSELQKQLVQLGDVIALDRMGVKNPEKINGIKQTTQLTGDLTKLTSLKRTIEILKPNLIVNAAAYTAVDKAEINKDLAMLVNAKAVAVLAQAAKKVQALLVHYSTDYVFDGTGEKPWSETDITSPINHYGRTKLIGENEIISSDCHYLIFRTSWVYGIEGSNFAKTILHLAKHKKQIKVISDQIGAPTSALLISKLSVIAISKTITNPSFKGIYHMAPKGECSWFDYANFLIRSAKNLGFSAACNKVLRTSTNEYHSTAKRPLNSRLNTKKLETNFDITLPDWKSSILEWLDHYLQVHGASTNFDNQIQSN